MLDLGTVCRADERSITWSVERGWPTATVDGRVVLGPVEASAALVTVDDKVLPLADTLLPVTAKKPDGTYETTYTLAKGVLVDRVEPFPALGRDALARTLTYTNTSDASQDLLNATMRLAPHPMPEGQTWNPQFFWMGEVSPGVALCTSYRGEDDAYRLEVNAEGRPSHVVESAWRLAPGQSAKVGTQVVWFGAAGVEPFRNEAQRWFQTIGLAIPKDSPAWLRDAIFYECNAGGHIDARFSDVGGFDHLAHQTDYLADLGVTTLWLQGVHEHKSPPDAKRGGWNLYDPRDFSKIDTILGGPEALKRLTDTLHGANLRIVGELVPHGGHSVQAEALEPWWTYTRQGTAQRNWGGCAMDYASPAWQAVMRDAAAQLARDYGMVGARIDVADGSGPNWKSPSTNHASFSTMGGAKGMLQAIRDGLAQGSDAPLLLPESFNAVEYFALTPLAYGHGTWMLFAQDLPPLRDQPAAMVSRLRDYFERERGSMPAGSLVLRTLNNHDSVCATGRVQYRYGAGLARALYGVCLMIEGVPMLYQEEEVGSFEALRRMNRARRSIPEFGHGEPDYTSIAPAPEVFACLRKGSESHGVGLSNLSGTAVKFVVELPAALAVRDGSSAFDAVSGREFVVTGHAFPCELGAYETALIRIGPRTNLVPRHDFEGEPPVVVGDSDPSNDSTHRSGGDGVTRFRSGRLVAELVGGGADAVLHVAHAGEETWAVDFEGSSSPELRVMNADRWMVSGRTAVLDDRVLRRHFPFPPEAGYVWNRSMPWVGPALYNGVAPTGRLWQSLLEPLHPDQRAVLFTDRAGSRLLLSQIDTNAHNIVLTDRTDELQPEPYGLALRFYVSDPDLDPGIAAFGLGQPWRMADPPKASPVRIRLRFRVKAIAPGDDEEVRNAMNANRLPVARGEAAIERSGNPFHGDADTWWFERLGSIAYTKLAKVPGSHRIRLELRYSEKSAADDDLRSAYEVRVNGELVPLEWLQRDTYHTGNAFFGYALTPAIDTGAIESLEIKTTRPWCALRDGLYLLDE